MNKIDTARDRPRLQRTQARFARLARADGSRGRGQSRQRRRARRRNRRHRRFSSAQNRQSRGAVRRHPRLSARPSRAREHSHLGQAHQSHVGQPAGRQRDGTRALLAALHEGSEIDSAGHAADRRGAGECERGQRHRSVQDPRAEVARARRRLLHRHRLHGGHARSRHRLDQLRRLPRAGARQECRLRDVLQGQARRHDPEEISRARPAVPDRGGVRHASGAVHDRGPRNSLRQERIRCRGRTAQANLSK